MTMAPLATILLLSLLVFLPSSSLCALVYESSDEGGNRSMTLTNFLRYPGRVYIQNVAIVDLYADKTIFNYCQLDDYT